MVPLRRSDNQLKRLTEASSTVPVVGSCSTASPRVSRGWRERPPKASLHDLPKTLRSDDTEASSTRFGRVGRSHECHKLKRKPLLGLSLRRESWSYIKNVSINQT